MPGVSSAAQASGTSTGTAVDASLARRDDPEELVHLVCCRDGSWETGFCGEPGGDVNLAATVVCTMCVEVVERMAPGALSSSPPRCPVDGVPCPVVDLERFVQDRIDHGPFGVPPGT